MLLHSGLKTLQSILQYASKSVSFSQGQWKKLCLVSQWDLTSAFPSGCMKRFPDTGVFKCRKWHSSWVLCQEGSAYDLSEHRQDFLSLPPWLLGWANSWPAHSPPITWAAKPPPLSAEGSHTTCSWLLKQVFLIKSL